MKLSNRQTDIEFVATLKALADYYWSTVMSKRLAVDQIIDELRVLRKDNRKADRWWHQYQNMRATMSDTVAAVQACRRYVADIEQRHGLNGGGPYQDTPIGSRCLVLSEPLCATCEAEPILDIDWTDAPNERKRFWRMLDCYTNDMRVGTAWIASQQIQVDMLPQSAVRDDLELAYSKLRWRLVQACSCSGMVGSRELNRRGVKATIDDGRMAYLPGEFAGGSEAVLERGTLCTNCASKVIPLELDTKGALEQVVDRRGRKQPIGA